VSDCVLAPETGIERIIVTIDERGVRVRASAPLTVLSSAVVGGGFAEAREIVNMHVDDVRRDERPEQLLLAFATTLGIDEPFVGLMTAARTENARLARSTLDGLAVASVVSMGLSNRVCAGVSGPAPAADGIPAAGTINAIVIADARLTPAALVNAVITATEAKALALGAFDVRTDDGLPVSGTSTDAVVVACTGRGRPLDYAGPATPVGHLIARTVREATERIGREQIARDGGRRIDW